MDSRAIEKSLSSPVSWPTGELKSVAFCGEGRFFRAIDFWILLWCAVFLDLLRHTVDDDGHVDDSCIMVGPQPNMVIFGQMAGGREFVSVDWGDHLILCRGIEPGRFRRQAMSESQGFDLREQVSQLVARVSRFGEHFAKFSRFSLAVLNEVV
jgi:hypothetical protein